MNGITQPSRLKPCVGGEAKRRQAAFLYERIDDRLVRMLRPSASRDLLARRQRIVALEHRACRDGVVA